ncbi:purine-binding chemotaxis protein CheW [candidate division KSB1 bacterium]|nr:MAG: purine-binding chemotaxis protein CheW [candidate division KSB1 bacterium]
MSITAFKARSAVGKGNRDLLFVSFKLGEDDYGVEVADVHGIYHGLPIIPNPDAPSFIEGDVQLAGRRIPVVNLRRFAGMADPAKESGTRWILMVNNSSGPVGLEVDRVIEVLRLTPQNLQDPDEHRKSPVHDYVVAVASHNGQSMFLPDISRLVNDAIP